MRRMIALFVPAALVSASVCLSAQGQIRQVGRAIVEYRSPDVKAVAAYEYSHRTHAGAWLLIELAVESSARIAFHRDQLSLVGPDERVFPMATQQQFLDDHETLNQLLQNAIIWRRPLGSYFLTRPQPTIRFFASPGGVVHDSAVSNRDQVAAGDLLFTSPDGRWAAGAYRLVLNHPQARAELPITLR